MKNVKNPLNEKQDLFKIDLQLFAEGDGEGEGSEGSTGGEGNAGDNTPKTFTQEEVNSLIAEQKRKIKEKYADYDEVKTQLTGLNTQLTTLQGEKENMSSQLSELETLEEKANKFNEYLEGQLTTALNKIPENQRDLVQGTNTMDKLNWISKAFETGLFKETKQSSTGSNPPAQPENTEGLSGFDFLKRGFAKK